MILSEKVILFPLTKWGQDQMARDLADNIFQYNFFSQNCFNSVKMHWSLFLMVQLTISHHWFWYHLGSEEATSHNLNQWGPSLLRHIYITRPRWVDVDDGVDLHLYTEKHQEVHATDIHTSFKHTKLYNLKVIFLQNVPVSRYISAVFYGVCT